MSALNINYYGSLCTEMYELLHPLADVEELSFFMSYATPDMKILEPLCGSGRFLVPFLEAGFHVEGIDSSREMLAKLLEKAPAAAVTQTDILQFASREPYDYAYVASSSMSLFTDTENCRRVLTHIHSQLKPGGLFVFGVDTLQERQPDSPAYQLSACVSLGSDRSLTLETRNTYIEQSRTQLSPGIYKLWHQGRIVRQEEMDFRTHLYEFGEMETLLSGAGFKNVMTYREYAKSPAFDASSPTLVFECRA